MTVCKLIVDSDLSHILRYQLSFTRGSAQEVLIWVNVWIIVSICLPFSVFLELRMQERIWSTVAPQTHPALPPPLPSLSPVGSRDNRCQERQSSSRGEVSHETRRGPNGVACSPKHCGNKISVSPVKGFGQTQQVALDLRVEQESSQVFFMIPNGMQK